MARRRPPKPLGFHLDAVEPFIHPENGKRSCRFCRGRVDSPRRTFCSANCVEQWKLSTDWKYLRQELFKRRHGRCEKCGLDILMVEPWWCEKQLAYANKIERGAKEPEWKRWKPQVAVDGDGRPWTSEFWEKQAVYAYRWHLENHCVGRDAFDVDHVLPVSIGGSYFEMSNLQILCFPDHVRKTREDGSRMVGRKKSRNPKES